MEKQDRDILKELNYRLLEPKSASCNKNYFVLIHGLKSSWLTFKCIIDELQCKYPSVHLLLYDQRGHGESTHSPDMDYSLSSMANDLYSLLQALHIHTPVHLLGHSFGARTMLKFYQLYPQMVKQMVVEDMHFQPSTKQLNKNQQLYINKAKEQKKNIPTHYSSLKECEQCLYKYLSKAQANDILKGRISINKDNSVDLKAFPYVITLYSYYSCNEHFQQDISHLSSQQILFILADINTSSVQSTHLSSLNKINPHIRTVRINNSMHNIHGTQTQKFLEQIYAFIKL